MIYKECVKHNKKIMEMTDALDDLSVDLEGLEEYANAYKKKIIIPKWTLLSDATPDDLEVYANHYCVFIERDFFFQAQWVNGAFQVFSEYAEDGPGWFIEKDVKYWMPIVYPEPY